MTSDDMTTEEWCAVYAERLPPLRDPAPADDELAGLLDQYVDRAERLAGGADGISDEGQAATETVATYFRELRDGVDAGGDLESLIDDEAFFSGPLFEAGTQIDAEAARLCSGDA